MLFASVLRIHSYLLLCVEADNMASISLPSQKKNMPSPRFEPGTVQLKYFNVTCLPLFTTAMTELQWQKRKITDIHNYKL